MKKSTIQTIIVVIAMLLMAMLGESCSSVKYGCPGQGSGLNFVGYR